MRISPFPYAQTATTSSSSGKSLSPNQEEQNIQVAELLPKRHRRRTSLIKLTDECLTAINEAIKKEWRIRITVDKANILIHVGNGTATPTIFQCSQQTLPGATDAIYREPSVSSSYQTISSLNTKLVVNATEKTFAETREKAQKLADEDAKKMVKDMTMKKDPMAKYRSNKGPMFKSTSTSFTPSTTTLKTTGFTPSSSNNQKRISPPISSTSQVNRPASPSVLLKAGATIPTTTTSSKPIPPPLTIQNRHELMKRSTRERCLHLLATCKYKTRTELLDRLRFEGAPKNERAEDFLNNAEAIIKEISQFDNSLDALFVKPKFQSEINSRWPWLLSSEREQLRRLIKPPSTASEESTSIAPMRRSGTLAPVAPSNSTNGSSTKTNNKPPEKVDKPVKSSKPSKIEKPINFQPAFLTTKPKVAENEINKQKIRSPVNGISAHKQEKPKRSPMISTPSSTNGSDSPSGRKRLAQPSPDQLDMKRPRVQSFNGKIEIKPSTPTLNGKYLEPMESEKRRVSNASDIGRPVKTTLKVESSLNELMDGGRRRISNASDIGRPVKSKQLNGKVENKLNGKVENKLNGKVEKKSPIPNGKHLELMDTSDKRRTSNASDIGKPIKNGSKWTSTNELEKQFPAVCDSKQAIKYHELFEVDYPKYRQYHEELTKVSKKFNELKRQFDNVQPGSNEQSDLLRLIQDTYDRYQTDKRYAETRRRHSQLHSRLTLLKRRVSDWEKRLTNGSSKPQLNRADISPMAQSNSRLTNRYRRERSASPGGSTTYSSNSAASTTSVESLGNVSHLYDDALF